MFLITFQLIIGVALLYYGAEWMVNGGVGIAKKFKVSPLIIGLTLVAFATSAPELTVSLDAALRGAGDIAIGNVVGSNTCNIGLILGLAALITPVAVNKQMLKVDAPVMLISLIALAVAGYYCSGFGRLVGAIFFIAFVIYTVLNIRASRKAEAAIIPMAEAEAENTVKHNMWWCLLLVVAGIVALVVGAGQMVSGAVAIGRKCGMSEAVIALTIVSIGTSLPELATSVVAAIKKQSDIAVGNAIGSNIFNTLVIMGLVPLIQPIKSVGVNLADWATMIAAGLLVTLFMRTGYKISRIEGGILLALYVGYLVYLVSRTVTP